MSYSFNPFSGNFDNVRDISGTTNQVNVAQAGDNFTLSTPQDIHTGATPQFEDMQVLGTGLGNRLVGKTLAQLSSTGVIKGLALSINADPAKFDLSSGTYEIVDNYTDPTSPVVTPVTYAGSTANTVTNLATADVTYILLDSSGNITQQTTFPTPSERRAKAFVGRLNHTNRTSITFANSFPDIKNGIVSQFYDLCDAMSPFKIGGLTITANGANLKFNRSAGSVFFRSNSWNTTPANPHTSTFTSATQQPFRKATQTGTIDLADVTDIDPTNYDLGGVVTAIPSSNNATIQRIYLYKSGSVRVQYGQTWYPNFAQAVAALNQDPFIPNPSVEQSAVLIGYIILTKNCSDLSNTNNCKIITAARFDAGGSAAAGGVTTLQQAYLNSVLPQIVLNSTQGAFTIDDASTPIGTLLDIRNNAGTTSFAKVDATGLSATGFTGTGTTGAVRLHNLTTAQGDALTENVGNIFYDVELYKIRLQQNTGRKASVVTFGTDTTGYVGLTGGDTIFLNVYDLQQTILVAGASGPVSLDGTAPFGYASTRPNGLRVTLLGTSDANAVTIPANDTANTIVGYSVTLGRGQSVTYEWSATLSRWFIVSTSN